MAKTVKETKTFIDNSKNLMSFDKSFALLNGQPLDKASIFSTKADAIKYAQSASAYVGKIVVVAEGDQGKEVVTAYIIDSDNTLKPVGDKATIDDLTERVNILEGDYTGINESVQQHTTDITELKAEDAQIRKDYAAADEQVRTDLGIRTDAIEKGYKAADTALDERLQAAEGKLKDVTNVMDFVGAVEKLPAGEELAKYQKGDVIVVTGGKEAGLEYVFDGAKFVEIGNSSSEQAAIARIEKEYKEADKSITEAYTAADSVIKEAYTAADKALDQRIDATEGSITNLTGVVDKKQTAEQVNTLISQAEIAQSQVTGLDTALKGKEDSGKAQELINGLTGVVTGTPAADSTITALAQANGVVTATVSKIAIAQDQVSGLVGDLADLHRGLDLKINTVTLQGSDKPLTMSEGNVTIPLAMAASFGLVKGNAVENGVEVNNGLMSVHSLNVNKLVQSEGEELILNGGNA